VAEQPAPAAGGVGTSGMKVVLNGGLNCRCSMGGLRKRTTAPTASRSHGRDAQRLETHDRMDREALYRVLTEDGRAAVLPRDRDGLPRAWIAR